MLKATCLAVPEIADELLAGEDDAAFEDNGQSANNSYHHIIIFDRATNLLILPSYINAQSEMELSDSHGASIKGSGIQQCGNKHNWQSELHQSTIRVQSIAKECKLHCHP